MKPLRRLLAVLLTICFVSISAVAQTPQKPDRQVAITIDDLPGGMANRLPAAEITAMTAKLLGTLRNQKVPVVGFVNEKNSTYPARSMNASRPCKCGSTTGLNWATTPSVMHH